MSRGTASPGARCALYFAVATLTACATAAPPHPPTLQSVQDHWSGDTGASTADPPRSAWWQAFHDPALDQLMAAAQLRNLDLRLAQARLLEARAQRAGANAALWPRLDASAGLSRAETRDASGSANGASTLNQLGVTASWEPDLFGRLRSARNAASATLQASAADVDAVRLVLLGEVARSYIEYRLYRAQQALSNKTAQAQESTLRISRARFAQGMSSRLDLERAITLVASTRAQVPQAQEQADAAFHRLVLLTAGTPDTLGRLLPDGGASSLPGSDADGVLQSPAQVLAQRPDVRAAEQRLLAASESRAAAQALRYPQLRLSALIGLRSSQADELLTHDARDGSVTAGLLAPLFDFGRIRAAIDVADARQQQALLGYESAVRSALREAQTAIVYYTQGKLRQGELALAVESARAAASLARRQYAEGALSQLEVLDAERSLYQAELSWSQATAEVSMRLVSLYQTLGAVPPLEQG